MKIQSKLLMVLLVVSLSGCGAAVTSAVTNSSYTTTTATVLKIYTVTDPSGHSFIAYVVDRNGTEVVVSDQLARTAHAVGDTIEYMDMKMALPDGRQTLSFTFLR